MGRGQDQQEGDRDGSTEAEPAVNQLKSRRGRAMAGLPQGGETPLGFSFLIQIHKSFVSTFTFWGQKICTTFVCWKFSLSYQNHHVNRVLDVETCCAENKYKIFVKVAILPRKRSEKLKEHA